MRSQQWVNYHLSMIRTMGRDERDPKPILTSSYLKNGHVSEKTCRPRSRAGHHIQYREKHQKGCSPSNGLVDTILVLRIRRDLV